MRFVAGFLVTVTAFLLGSWAFDIHPTIPEVLLVAIACGLGSGVEEGMR